MTSPTPQADDRNEPPRYLGEWNEGATEIATQLADFPQLAELVTTDSELRSLLKGPLVLTQITFLIAGRQEYVDTLVQHRSFTHAVFSFIAVFPKFGALLMQHRHLMDAWECLVVKDLALAQSTLNFCLRHPHITSGLATNETYLAGFLKIAQGNPDLARFMLKTMS